MAKFRNQVQNLQEMITEPISDDHGSFLSEINTRRKLRTKRIHLHSKLLTKNNVGNQNSTSVDNEQQGSTLQPSRSLNRLAPSGGSRGNLPRHDTSGLSSSHELVVPDILVNGKHVARHGESHDQRWGAVFTGSASKTSLLQRSALEIDSVVMKKSDPGKLAFKGLKAKISKSPNLPKKQSHDPPSSTATAGDSAPMGESKNRHASGGSGSSHPNPLSLSDDFNQSSEELDMGETGSSRENGSSTEAALDEVDAHSTDPVRQRAALEHIQGKVQKVKDNIKAEQANKEANVNEYLRLAANADKQQLQRIKTVFEKKNQKSAQTINQLQKKLETYHKRMKDVEIYGAPSHKQAKEVLRDVGQGIKDVGANIFDGITGFSGGVVDNIKGAKDTIVSKPREFAHRIIKIKSGSADNINQLKMDTTEGVEDDGRQGGGTLPASFKYSSDDDNSSITSGSGFGAHSSPHSTSQNASQQLAIVSQSLESVLQPMQMELQEHRETNRRLHDSMQRVLEEFDSYKTQSRADMNHLKTVLEEERYRFTALEEQINDLTELHQNEVTNLRQDITSMEEKIEYQLEERTRDMHDILESCQTRITKMELQQQQQQIISMEMVDNVTFRTLLTKLINVALALIAVILVFVSTSANLLGPFLTTRARILTTCVMIFVLIVLWREWNYVIDYGIHIRQQYGPAST